MLVHLFKLIWNKKGSHALLMVEILASFMVLFGVMTLIVYNFRNYLEPIGFNYDNSWTLNLARNQDTTATSEKLITIFQKIKSYPEVENASRMSNNSPFSGSTWNGNVSYNKTTTTSDMYWVDEFFTQTLAIPSIEGRWFQKADRVAKYTPVMINSKAKEELFGNASALGKTIKADNEEMRIVGVIDNFKAKGEFMQNNPAVIKLMKEDSHDDTILIKVKPGTDANFEAKLTKDIGNMVTGWTVEVSYMSDQRQNQHNLALVPVIIFLIISAFLLVNVALGLFGILNLNIAKRREEIGMRRALGATEGSIKKQFVGEIWVIASFSLLIGIIFAIQFPIMNIFDLEAGIYLIATFVSILIIYIIVTLCAYYPSRQAAKIQPAMALHEE